MLVERAFAWWAKRAKEDDHGGSCNAGRMQVFGLQTDFAAFEALHCRLRKLHAGFPLAHSMEMTRGLLSELEDAGYRLVKGE